MTPQEICILRESLGLTRAEFGRELGYAHPRQRIWELELGKKQPSSAVIKLMQMMMEKKNRMTQMAEIRVHNF